MSRFLTLLVLLLTTFSADANWHRISESTLRFSGEVKKGDYEDYLALSKHGFTRIELQSFGGMPFVALKIAEDIVSRDVEIYIDGYCFSACANYLALSSKRLTVPCGSVLAWHGSPTNETEAEILRTSEEKGYPKEFLEKYLNWARDFRAREDGFYKKMGINRSLLLDSVIIPKRKSPSKSESTFSLDQETGAITVSTTQTAAAWIPTVDVLMQYGVPTQNFCKKYSHDDIKLYLKKQGMQGLYFSSDAQ